LYESTQRDLRNKQVEVQRITGELDKTREQKDQLGRENKKLGDDLRESKNSISELTRRLHEYELEIRRLENEREELTAAYKEAEAGRKAEEKRAQALSTEYGTFRHEAERRIAIKEEEIETIRKQTSIEIEQLNARVIEAETKLKSEVQRIKKKFQIQITELEMSLDVANHTNIDLQKTIKRQSLQLTEITSHYEDLQRQLQTTMDQYNIAQRRVQALTGELEELRVNYEQSLRSKRSVELQYEESQSRNSELNTINISLQNTRAKIEAELASLASDYEEVTRELRLSDERYQKVQVELKHTVEILHEEQERIVKIEAIKKSLEVEVKNLSVRLEEVEANAVVGARRAISKLESTVRDLELELDSEKKNHAETIKILRKKERTVKEIVIQCEEDQKNVLLLQEQLDKANGRLNQYKRQLSEQEGFSAQSVTRSRRIQRELEAAEERAEVAESNLNMVRTKHRSFVTTSTVPGGQVYLVSETVTRRSSVERN
jgi:chromosome segregation ATPase